MNDNPTGVYYRLMVEHVKKVLADLKGVVPDYDPAQGYELAGFVWFQGWNDMVDSGTYPNRDKPARKADLQARSPRLEQIRSWWREAAQAEGADIVDLANTLAPATELVANSN